ncbi:MAG: TRAP transporter small permease [Bauldia sp.]|uniref:TRAP transporter small permease n=1 Tax=Bauldia sp. TaxID=2575872 RepID=UPI001E0B6D1B|nr:TRAP transporter small permease [Bauldia sp.]MCB1497596.1 TRAP transporter small permease [Bauldia sp.]
MSFAYESDREGASGPRPSFLGRLVRSVIRYWALLGGFIIVALVLLTAASALSNLVWNRPIPGDYELTKHFVAIAIFTFLPYCQLTGANVTVDIFTEGMSARARSAMVAFASLFAIAFSLLLLRQMSLGFEDYLRYPETTATLGLPLWTAFPPILVSLALLLVAAVVTLIEGWRGCRGAADETAATAE